MRPFLADASGDGVAGRARRHKLYWAIVAAIAIAVGLAVVKLVVLKMLPFDNKSEFQVIVNMPEGTPVESTARVLDELAHVIETVPEVTDYQAYAGTAAPINFNGLVRQYYLRQSPELGDLQVNLVDKHERDRKSHEIALAVRPTLAAIGKRYGASVQVVEVPPGPPVQAPIVAEVSVDPGTNAGSWLEIKVDGQTVFRKVLGAGQSLPQFKAQRDFWVRAGNASVVSVVVNGQRQCCTANPGDVITFSWPPR